MIPLAFILYSALLSMSSPVKVPVVIRFFFCLAVYDGSFEAGSVFDLDGFTCNHQTNSYRFIQSNYRYIIAAIISNAILLPQRHFCENLYFSNSSFE